MINYHNVLKKILLKDEENFFHGLSFIIISLIAIHLVIYFNFYKFSSNWIENESNKTTFILINNFDEKEIPIHIEDKIINFLSSNSKIEGFKVMKSDVIQETLGLEGFSDLSALSLPLVFQITSEKQNIIDDVYKNLLDISENRLVEKHNHEDQLYEISIIVSRIKLIIFIMFLFVLTLFSFLVMNIVKAALIANVKFIEMLQVMGASSLELAKNISTSIFKKIFPGTFLGIIFIFLVSILLIKLFGVNFNFFNSSYFYGLIFSNFILLIIFLITFSLLFTVFLTMYLFSFFEKRFFDKL
tara:strand:+ start:113 stop:1012 length:900 start_codon:yes stop_codon:yes gene_type:complete